jgi:ribosome-associated toxin RatA of RatAB toxin-antitoxin module
MPDLSTQSIVIHAEPARVMAVIADFAAYPEWTGAIKSVDITVPGTPGRARQVRYVMDAGLLKDTYELAYTWAPDGLSVSWDLVSGSLQKAQRGSYRLQPVADGTEVTYSLNVEPSIPLIGPLRRKAERSILDTALKELRKRVEHT